jgi:hypothetical protein
MRTFGSYLLGDSSCIDKAQNELMRVGGYRGMIEVHSQQKLREVVSKPPQLHIDSRRAEAERRLDGWYAHIPSRSETNENHPKCSISGKQRFKFVNRKTPNGSLT